MIAPDSASVTVAVDDDGRLAERMDGAQGGRREHRDGIARVKPDLVGSADFLEQPENPVGTRVLEVMHNNQRRLLRLRFAGATPPSRLRLGQGDGGPSHVEGVIRSRASVFSAR